MIVVSLLAGALSVGVPAVVPMKPTTQAEVSAAIERSRISRPATPGGSVYDESGHLVGTVSAVDAKFITLVTGRHKVRLPINAVAPLGSTYVIKATAAQLDMVMSGMQRPKAASAK